MWIGYKPITFEGRMTLLAMGASFAIFATLSLLIEDPGTSALFGILAVAEVSAGHFVIFKKWGGDL
jgi:hypothetical protein